MKVYDANEPLFITRSKFKQILLACSIMILLLYLVAMICSLTGNQYFILHYDNEQLNNIESFLRSYNAIAPIQDLFITLETFIILCFILGKQPRWYYIVPIYLVPLIIAYSFGQIESYVETIILICCSLFIPIIDTFVSREKFSWKRYGFQLIKFVIAALVTLALQAMILVIKAGYFDGKNHIMNLSSTFVYAVEYDIALSVILFTISHYIHRDEGGDSKWISQHHGGSSQTSKKKLQRSKLKNLTKTQRNKIALLYLKLYAIQLGTFLLVLILPFLLGKVLEFLVMYSSFCVIRMILGFKYSLHFKKESICVTVGLIVFGILTLVVPSFYIILIGAIIFGAALAILLHLSYKYKSFYLFNKIAKPDKFAELYVLMDQNLEPTHVKMMCIHYRLKKEHTQIVCMFAEGNKKSYIAKKLNYSEKSIERKLNEAIDLLKNNI